MQLVLLSKILSVKSMLDNYSELLCFLQQISDTQRGDVGYKSNGSTHSARIKEDKICMVSFTLNRFAENSQKSFAPAVTHS